MIKAQAIRYTNTRWRYQALLLIGVFAGAWASIFGRIAQEEGIPTPIIIAFRMTAGTLVITPFVLTYYRAELRALSRKQVLLAAVAGFWLAINLMTGFGALEHTTVLINGVLSGTAPLWIALLETFFLKARMNQYVWIGLSFALAGGGIIAVSGMTDLHLGNNPALGSILSISSAIAGAIYLLVGRSVRKGIPFLPYLWMVFTAGSIISLSVVLVSHEHFQGYSQTGYFALIMLTLLPQLISHAVLNYTVRHIPATYISVVNQLGIIISAVLAIFFFNELPTALQVPGSAAIIVGITLVNLGMGKLEK